MFAGLGGSLPFLSAVVAYVVNALGYLSLIAVVNALLKSIGGFTRGPRYIILAVLAAGAALQLVLMLLFTVSQNAGTGLNIIAAAFFLAVPVSFAPLLQRIEDGAITTLAKPNPLGPADDRGASPAWHSYVARNPSLPASRTAIPLPNDYVRLSVIAHHSPTGLTQLGAAVAEANSVIAALSVLHRQHDIVEMSVEVGIVDESHLKRIIAALRGTRGVQQVEKLTSQ